VAHCLYLSDAILARRETPVQPEVNEDEKERVAILLPQQLLAKKREITDSNQRQAG